ncbi:hypothetical protein Tco_0019721 [Tanacetum coccineum]
MKQDLNLPQKTTGKKATVTCEPASKGWIGSRGGVEVGEVMGGGNSSRGAGNSEQEGVPSESGAGDNNLCALESIGTDNPHLSLGH